MTGPADDNVEPELPLEVSQAMSLLLAAARIDPVLIDAARKVDRHLHDLQESREFWCTARSEDISTDLAGMRERDAAAQTLIGLLRYHLGDHEAAGKDFRPYRDYQALSDSGRRPSDG